MRNKRKNNSLVGKNKWFHLVVGLALLGLAVAADRYGPRESGGADGELPANITGRARIIDGDSLRVAGKEVRLQGIDAPEGRQNCTRFGKSWPCGRRSADKLKSLTSNSQVACEVSKRDRYRRFLATCFVGRKNINREMVVRGWAVSYGRYKSAEKRARTGRRGIWIGEFERPRAWRDKHNRRR